MYVHRKRARRQGQGISISVSKRFRSGASAPLYDSGMRGIPRKDNEGPRHPHVLPKPKRPALHHPATSWGVLKSVTSGIEALLAELKETVVQQLLSTFLNRPAPPSRQLWYPWRTPRNDTYTLDVGGTVRSEAG